MANVARSVSLVAMFIIAMVDATATIIVEPPSACPDIIPSVIDCLSYISNGSIAARPSKACCIGIASVIKGSTTVCLCKSLEEALNYGVPINMTRILGLPVACSVDAHKIDCSGVFLDRYLEFYLFPSWFFIRAGINNSSFLLVSFVITDANSPSSSFSPRKYKELVSKYIVSNYNNLAY